MKTPVISSDLVSALKALRLGPILDSLPERLVLAEKQQMAFEELLLMLLTDEINRRQSSAATRRADQAGLDPDLVLERWDKTAKVHFDRRVFQELCSLRFIEIVLRRGRRGKRHTERRRGNGKSDQTESPHGFLPCFCAGLQTAATSLGDGDKANFNRLQTSSVQTSRFPS